MRFLFVVINEVKKHQCYGTFVVKVLCNIGVNPIYEGY